MVKQKKRCKQQQQYIGRHKWLILISPVNLICILFKRVWNKNHNSFIILELVSVWCKSYVGGQLVCLDWLSHLTPPHINLLISNKMSGQPVSSAIVQYTIVKLLINENIKPNEIL